MPERQLKTLEDVVIWVHAHEALTEEKWKAWDEKKLSDADKFKMLFIMLDQAKEQARKVEMRVMYICGAGSVVGALAGTLFSLLIKPK